MFLSSVSAWEIAVKTGLGRLAFSEPPEQLIPYERDRHGVETLPLDERSVFHVARLPALHRDPFDRMLVAQSIEENLPLVTNDRVIARYPAQVLW